MDDIFFIKEADGKQVGPFTVEQLKTRAGFNGDSLVRNVADSDWMSAREVSALAGAIEAAGVTQVIPVEIKETRGRGKKKPQAKPAKTPPATEELHIPPRQRRQQFLNINPKGSPGSAPEQSAKRKPVVVGSAALPRTVTPKVAWIFYGCAAAWLLLNVAGFLGWISDAKLHRGLVALGGTGGFALGGLGLALLTQIRNQARLIAARQVDD